MTNPYTEESAHLKKLLNGNVKAFHHRADIMKESFKPTEDKEILRNLQEHWFDVVEHHEKAVNTAIACDQFHETDRFKRKIKPLFKKLKKLEKWKDNVESPKSFSFIRPNVKSNLKNYINEMRDQGKTDKFIKAQLINNGWKESTINNLL